MITLDYTEDGEAVTEFNYERWTRELLDAYNMDREGNLYYEVCTEIPLLCVRKEVAEGRINREHVTFIVGAETYLLNELAEPVSTKDGTGVPEDTFASGFHLVCAIHRATRHLLPPRETKCVRKSTRGSQ